MFIADEMAQWIKGSSYHAEECPSWTSKKENQFLKLPSVLYQGTTHTHNHPTNQPINEYKNMPIFRVQAQFMKCSLRKQGLSWDVQQQPKSKEGDPCNGEAEVPGSDWSWSFQDSSDNRYLLSKTGDRGSVPRTHNRRRVNSWLLCSDLHTCDTAWRHSPLSTPDTHTDTYTYILNKYPHIHIHIYQQSILKLTPCLHPQRRQVSLRQTILHFGILCKITIWPGV